jgi:hypothetical protein
MGPQIQCDPIDLAPHTYLFAQTCLPFLTGLDLL